MSLFPNQDILINEIEAWKGFTDSLRAKDKELFIEMLNDCCKYALAINTKGEPFPAESLLMALLLEQQKIIEMLISNSNYHSAKKTSGKRKS
ncbi:MAG: hypothetical protein WBP64_15315 [Nitrososphaeraceae archaeon]